MRSVLPVVLAAVLAAPALAQAGEPPREQVPDKIRLQHLDPNDAVALVASDPPGSLPAGIESLLGFQPDNSLILRGEPEAVASLRSAVEVIDAPVVGDSLTVTLRRADPAAVRSLALSPPGVRTVHLGGARLRFTGDAEQLARARALVFRAELRGDALTSLGQLLAEQPHRTPLVIPKLVQHGRPLPAGPPSALEIVAAAGTSAALELSAGFPPEGHRTYLALTLSSGLTLTARGVDASLREEGGEVRLLLEASEPGVSRLEIALPRRDEPWQVFSDGPGSLTEALPGALGSPGFGTFLWLDHAQRRLFVADLRRVARGEDDARRLVAVLDLTARPPGER